MRRSDDVTESASPGLVRGCEVVTTVQMRELDRRTIELGTPGLELMERAGRGIACEILGPLGDAAARGVVVVAGRGNNGGDGFVVARLVAEHGWPVKVWLVGDPARVAGDVRTNLERWVAGGGKVETIAEEAPFPAQATADLGCAGVIVDALFGTGLNAPVGGAAARAIAAIAGARSTAASEGRAPVVVAVDLPSGLDGDTGEPWGTAVAADVTVTLGATKIGLVLPAARPFVGRLVEVDIGLAVQARSAIAPLARAAGAADMACALPVRRASGHKGTHGHVLVVAGSAGKSGAAILAGRAAIRGGAGLTTIATPAAIRDLVAAALPEAMTEAWPARDPEAWRGLLAGRGAVVVGPGLGRDDAAAWTAGMIVASAPVPVVVDADGLNAIAADLESLRRAPGVRILTPHPGEMARLCGRSTAEVQGRRLEVAREIARRSGAVVVLKGAGTVTAAPDGRAVVNTTGGPILGTGGTGDVLAGLIGALLAQGVEPFAAACLGVFLHGAAGDRIAARLGDSGLLASELADEIPLARRALSLDPGDERCGSGGPLL